jgi:type VI secretion system protein ImpK
MALESHGAGYAPAVDKPAGELAGSAENLGLLYQGLLTSVVRLRTGRQHITDGASFRKRTKSTIAEIERFAVAAGYEASDIKDAHFAVVAFLDEVILNSSDPVRADWERRMLQEELFSRNDAGVVFFDNLTRLQSQRDSQRLADVLEVFLLCLLLGFQGRYAGAQKSGLESIAAGLVKRVQDIRGRAREISPHGIPDAHPVAAQPSEARKSAYFPQIAFGAVALTAVLFLVFYWNLSLLGERVLNALGNGG